MNSGSLRQRSYARLSSSSACTSVSATNTPPYWPKCPRSSGSSTIFILHCSDEGRDFRGVLDSLRSLDAAGDIDGVGLHTADGAGNVIGRQAARKDDGSRHALRHQAPVERASRSAPEIAVESVEHPCPGARVWREVFYQIQPGANPRRFDIGPREPGAEFGRFLAVELQQRHAAFANNLFDLFARGIDEYGHRRDEGRRLLRYIARALQRDVARTRAIEHQPDRISALGRGGTSVLDPRDAADFDSGSHRGAAVSNGIIRGNAGKPQRAS